MGVRGLNESRFYRFFRPVIPKFLRPFALKNQKILSYVFFGALTTLVNFAIYFPVKLFLGYLVANVIAWVGAVAFAFVTNKLFVFEEDHWERDRLVKQAGSFVAARLFSLLVEEATLFIFVELLHFSENWMKLIAQVIVLVLNYIFSNLIVFKK